MRCEIRWWKTVATLSVTSIVSDDVKMLAHFPQFAILILWGWENGSCTCRINVMKMKSSLKANNRKEEMNEMDAA